jgi:hypothetical protein
MMDILTSRKPILLNQNVVGFVDGRLAQDFVFDVSARLTASKLLCYAMKPPQEKIQSEGKRHYCY